MKNSKYFLLQILALAAYFSIVTACHKDPAPTVYGKWETVNAFGYHWNYSFEKGGQFCKSLPEYFPDSFFCFDYSVDGNLVTIDAPDDEVWAWEFLDQDLADVRVTLVDGSLERFILKRIK